jgi:hypothetical protein
MNWPLARASPRRQRARSPASEVARVQLSLSRIGLAVRAWFPGVVARFSQAGQVAAAVLKLRFFGPFSPEDFAKGRVFSIVLTAKSLRARAGVRGLKWTASPPRPDPLPHEFAESLNRMEISVREFVGERGQRRNFKRRRRGARRRAFPPEE